MGPQKYRLGEETDSAEREENLGKTTPATIESTDKYETEGKDGTITVMDCEDEKKTEVNSEGEDIIRRVGKGGQGTCCLVRDRKTRQLMVRKTLEVGCHSPTEVKILAGILPPNERIIEFRKFIVTPNPYTAHIYFDYYNGGDLHDFIFNYLRHPYYIPEPFIWHVLLHLGEAIAFLHYGYDRSSRPTPTEWTGVIHRDIKPENILLRLPTRRREMENGVYPSVFLADFGHATSTICSDGAGTVTWQPPEHPLAMPKGDCWAVGAVINAMCLDGKPPIAPMPKNQDDDEESRTDWQHHPTARTVRDIPERYSWSLQSVLSNLLKQDWRERFNSLQLLNAVVKHYEDQEPTTQFEKLEPFAFEHLNHQSCGQTF